MGRERFAKCAEKFPESLLLLTGEGTIIGCNQAAADHLGIPSAALCGTSLQSLSRSPSDNIRIALRLWAGSGQMVYGPVLLETKGVAHRCQGALWEPRAGDQPALILLRLQGPEAVAGKFVALNLKIEELAREIRTRKHSERRVEEEKERLRVTLASIGDAVIATDDTGIVEFINPTAEMLTGWNFADACGRRIEEVFHIVNENSRRPAENPVDRVLREGVIVGLANHTVLISRDGTERSIDDSAAPIRNETRSILGVVLVFRDISDRRKADLALRSTQDQLNAAQHALEEHARNLERTVEERTARLRETVGELEAFSYTVSHDLRAPLRAMQSYAQIALSDYGEQIGPDGALLLNKIVKSGEILDGLIRDVLDYSRVSRMEIKLEELDLEQLLKETILRYPQFQKVESNIVFEPPLGRVRGNRALLGQCFSNLFGNALKFARPGVPPTIKVRAEPRPPEVRIWVEDNGIGIPEKDYERIFKIFEQINPGAKHDGTGIGLSIVRKAIERMGGSVGVESKLDKGSRFWLQLSGSL